MLKVFRISNEARERAPASDFVGEVYRQRLHTGLSTQFMASVVNFYDGAHNVPHTHKGDHLLIITEGEAFIKTDNEEHNLTAGDVVFISGGIKHCHGAQPHRSMTQIAFLAGNE